MRLHLLFFLLFFSNYYLSAQIVYRDAGQKTDTIELRNMYSKALSVLDSTKKKGFQIDRMDIVEINETKYLIPNGMFDVYRWTNGQWDNMYKVHSRDSTSVLRSLCTKTRYMLSEDMDIGGIMDSSFGFWGIVESGTCCHLLQNCLFTTVIKMRKACMYLIISNLWIWISMICP